MSEKAIIIEKRSNAEIILGILKLSSLLEWRQNTAKKLIESEAQDPILGELAADITFAIEADKVAKLMGFKDKGEMLQYLKDGRDLHDLLNPEVK